MCSDADCNNEFINRLLKTGDNSVRRANMSGGYMKKGGVSKIAIFDTPPCFCPDGEDVVSQQALFL